MESDMIQQTVQKLQHYFGIFEQPKCHMVLQLAPSELHGASPCSSQLDPLGSAAQHFSLSWPWQKLCQIQLSISGS
jgi:hypothetical protein